MRQVQSRHLPLKAPLLHDPTIFGGRPIPYNDRQSLVNHGPKPALLGAGGGNGFAPNFSPPEYHPSENWKPTPTGTHVGLMKDAPLTRNGPANFLQPAQKQGAVMMVYGLDNNTDNTDKLFNLFCLYGNVNFLSEFTNPYTLPDNSISFKDYSASKNNRLFS
ncbi:heterogeneous nuclear ribonucleoprotein L-like [Ochlerotatus camptorhynchus]|uniref:heterogeneous nuclear ribonucleoprotein L-like n=1 Tax=Ochlerotatus camptorhynchus TaxID=644619 RepID=UPI0031E15DF5